MERSFEVKMKLTGKVLVFAESAAEAEKQVLEMNELDIIDEMYENGDLELMYVNEVVNNDPEDFI